jgi:hypothetical protein
VLGAAQIKDRQPDRTILLDRVGTQLFWDIFPDHAFRAVDVADIYLTPQSVSEIGRLRPQPDPADFALSRGAMRDYERIVVFDASGVPLRETTRAYFDKLAGASDLPARIDLASPLATPFLGGTWHDPEAGHRWMGKQASLRLASPKRPEQNLRIFAHCPENVAAAGPVILDVSINGVPMPPATLKLGEVELFFPLPGDAGSKSALEVTLTVRHTVRAPGDDRDLGLPIRIVEVR